MGVRKIHTCVVIRRMEPAGAPLNALLDFHMFRVFVVFLAAGSQRAGVVGRGGCALICSQGREQPHASTFQTLAEFISSPASVWALTVYSSQSFLGMFGRGGGVGVEGGVDRSAVIYARKPAVACFQAACS